MTTATAKTTTLAALAPVFCPADENGRYPMGQTVDITVSDAENRRVDIVCLDLIKRMVKEAAAIGTCSSYHFQAETKVESAGWDDDRFYLHADLYLVVWVCEKHGEVRPTMIRILSTTAANGAYENCGGQYEAQKFLEAFPNIDCPLTSAWKAIMAEFPIVPMNAREEMRTACILRLVDKSCNEIMDAAIKNLRKGDQVRVFKGRKVPVGTTGKVVGFFSGKFGMRVAIDSGSGKVDANGRPEAVWTSIDNVEVIVPDLDAKAVEKAKETYMSRYSKFFGAPRA